MLKGSLSPLLLESCSIPPAPAWYIPCRGRGSVSPQEAEGWSYGALRPGWTAGRQGPPVGWPGHPLPLCQIRDAWWQCGQGARGGGSISLSLSASAMGGLRQEANAASVGTMPCSRCWTVPLRSPVDPRDSPEGLLGLPEGTLCPRIQPQILCPPLS